MKKLLILSFIFIQFLPGSAQNMKLKTPSLGVSFFLNDFQAAADVRSQGIASVINQHHLLQTSRMNPGVAINYIQGISNHLDFVGTFGGSFTKFQNDNIGQLSDNHFLLEATANINFKLLPDNYALVPFADLGLGASKYIGYYGAFSPVGLGLQLKLFDQSYLILNSQYRIPVTNNVNYHFYHAITFVANLSEKKK